MAAAPARAGSRGCSSRLGGVLRAIHTGARLVLAPHPEAAGRFDAIWIAGGRVVDWGAGGRLAAGAALGARASARRPRRGKLGGWLPADAVAEARLVGAWIAANAPPTLELGARTGEAAHTAFLARAGLHYGCRRRQRERQRLAVRARAQRSPAPIVLAGSRPSTRRWTTGAV